MPNFDDLPEPEPATFALKGPRADVIWGVTGAIALLALIGGFLGFQNVRTGDIMPTGWVAGATASNANIASAAPAVIMPRDDQWSTLSGPKLLPPAPPKAPRAAAKDDEDDADSASPAQDTAAAQAEAKDLETGEPLPAGPAGPAQGPAEPAPRG